MGILRRTIFFDNSNKKGEKYHRLWDWAIVTTTLGTMMEPFNLLKYPHQTCLAQNWDPEDEMARVDHVEFQPYDPTILSNGETAIPTMGGIMMPRDGR